MEMRVYYEDNIENKKLNRMLGVGEDAMPYCDGRLISVADGSGGSGSMPIISLRRECTDSEKVFDTVMKQCLPEGLTESYRSQFDENFSQLYELGYEDYVKMGGRPSGYFGSRLISVLMRSALDQEFSGDALKDRFEALSQLDPTSLDSAMDVIEQRLKARLELLLQRAIKNGGYQASRESLNNNGMMLTTYSGILFQESETWVHALSVQVGDSKLWSAIVNKGQNGPKLELRMLLPTQETISGLVKNYIGAERPFYIRCAYHKLEKPCALLAASDGAYDYFPTPIHFERFLMYNLMNAHSIGECEQGLTQYYQYCDNPDDSATIAFRAFGFEDYDSLAKLANQRQIELVNTYRADDETLYSIDKDAQYWLDSAQIELNEKVQPFMDAMWEQSASLRRDVFEETSKLSPIQVRLQAIEEGEADHIAEMKDRQRAVQEKLIDNVREEWLSLRDFAGVREESDQARPGGLWGMSSHRDSYNELLDRRRALEVRLSNQVANVKTRLSSWQRLTEKFEIQPGIDAHGFTAQIFELTSMCDNAWRMLDRELGEMDKNRQELYRIEDRIESMKKRIIWDEREEIARFADRCCQNPESVWPLLVLLKENGEEIDRLARQARALRVQQENARKTIEDKKSDLVRDIFLKKDRRFTGLALRCAENYSDELSEELRKNLEEALQPGKEQLEKAKHAKKLREHYLNLYEKTLTSIMAERG